MKKIFLMVISLLMLGLCCKDEPTKPTPTGTVKLTLDYAECKEIGLKLNFTDANQPRGYVLLRDGEQITSGTLGNTEILLVDTTVLPGRDYTYIAHRLNDSQTYDSSTPLAVRSLDSTSHAVQWFVDTLGAQGVIRDVWVFDRNNAWAVGEIYLKDSAGQINMSNPYNSARWNGSRWDLIQIPVPVCGTTFTKAYPLYAIYAFSESNIFFSSGGHIEHWDGKEFTWSCAINPLITGAITKIWGTSEKELFAVSRGGDL